MRHPRLSEILAYLLPTSFAGLSDQHSFRSADAATIDLLDTPVSGGQPPTSALSLLTEAFTPPPHALPEQFGSAPASEHRFSYINPFDQLTRTAPPFPAKEAHTGAGDGVAVGPEELNTILREILPSSDTAQGTESQPATTPSVEDAVANTSGNLQPSDADILREKALELRKKTPVRAGTGLAASTWADSPRMPALTLTPKSVSPSKDFQLPVATPIRIRAPSSSRLNAASPAFVPTKERLALELALRFYEERTASPQPLAPSRESTKEANEQHSEHKPEKDKRTAKSVPTLVTNTATPTSRSSKVSITPEQAAADRAKGRDVVERRMSRDAAAREYPHLYNDAPSSSPITTVSTTPTPAARVTVQAPIDSTLASANATQPPVASTDDMSATPSPGTPGLAAQMLAKIHKELLQADPDSDIVGELRALAAMLEKDAKDLDKIL